jgi:hypothetical protein
MVVEVVRMLVGTSTRNVGVGGSRPHLTPRPAAPAER